MQTKGEYGVKKSEHFADVIYGSSPCTRNGRTEAQSIFRRRPEWSSAERTSRRRRRGGPKGRKEGRKEGRKGGRVGRALSCVAPRGSSGESPMVEWLQHKEMLPPLGPPSAVLAAAAGCQEGRRQRGEFACVKWRWHANGYGGGGGRPFRLSVGTILHFSFVNCLPLLLRCRVTALRR